MGCPDYSIQNLQKVQNSAARLFLKCRKREHVQPLLRKLHWLPVQFRIQYKLSTMCFNSVVGDSPLYLSDLLSVYRPKRELRSSADNLILSVPPAKTKSFGGRAFSCAGPVQWNSLPFHLRHSSSLPTFKSQLKTHLFRKASH